MMAPMKSVTVLEPFGFKFFFFYDKHFFPIDLLTENTSICF